MAWKTGLDQLIAGPAVALLDLTTSGSPTTVGEIEKDIQYSLTPVQKMKELESKKVPVTVAYELEMTINVAQLVADNLTEVETLRNEDVDLQIDQQAFAFVNPKSYSVSGARVWVDGSGVIGRDDDSKLTLKVYKYITDLGTDLTITDAADA